MSVCVCVFVSVWEFVNERWMYVCSRNVFFVHTADDWSVTFYCSVQWHCVETMSIEIYAKFTLSSISISKKKTEEYLVE